jgi:hypothetical protein
MTKDQVKEDEMGTECNTHEAKRKAYRILAGEPEGKILLRRPRRRWEANIKMDLGEIGWGGMDWIDLAHDRNHWRDLANKLIFGLHKILDNC